MEIKINERDRSILRGLADRLARIADLPINKERVEMWTMLNDLKRVRPLVLIYEIPWHEMDVDGQLAIKCKDPQAQVIEEKLRRTIYQWEHMPGDMVVEGVIYSPLIVWETPILEAKMETVGLAKRFKPQIIDEEDIQKIRMPEVVYDNVKTEEYHALYQRLFGDIIAVETQRHPPASSLTPMEVQQPPRAYGDRLVYDIARAYRIALWDQLVTWTGLQEALRDLMRRPQFIHALLERLTQAHLHRLDQYEALGLLPRSNNECLTGTGGLGYTESLPRPKAREGKCTTQDLWGAAWSQPLGMVSPDMHEEVGLRYEVRWLSRFGLAYYGCCDPLHHKIEILRKNIPNLRKISCSAWADVASFAEQCGDDYVISLKPNPAIFAEEHFDLEAARKELVAKLSQARGCNVEVIMKDISTVRREPQRLWKWAEMAVEVAETFS